MKSVRNLLTLCAGLVVATALPLRADFAVTSSLNPANDNATTSTGSGTVDLDWMAASNTFTYTLSWTNLTGPATMAHIHFGAPGVSGAILLPFFMPTSPAGYLPATDTISGTLTAADLMPDSADGISTMADVATAIENGDAYANIHTAAYPNGELRGQLAVSTATATPEPATAGLLLMALGVGVVAFTRKRLSATV